jgi:hypothetical protein
VPVAAVFAQHRARLPEAGQVAVGHRQRRVRGGERTAGDVDGRGGLTSRSAAAFTDGRSSSGSASSSAATAPSHRARSAAAGSARDHTSGTPGDLARCEHEEDRDDGCRVDGPSGADRPAK